MAELEKNWGVGAPDAPTSIPTEEQLFGYTVKQWDRFTVFSHIVELADAYEQRLNNGEKFWATQTVKAPGKKTQQGIVLFPIDRNFVAGLKEMAFHMYADEFRLEPEMQAAADDYLKERQEKKVDHKEEEVAALRRMWDTK